MASLTDSSILVTGGSGTLGGALIHYLLKELPIDQQPRKVICFSRRWQEQEKLRRMYGDNKLRLFIGDVRDEARLLVAMRGVDYIIHAAALKDIVHAEYNPDETLYSNCVGTLNVLRAANTLRTPRVLVVSSDKGVNASTLYGSSKHMAEALAVAYQSYVTHDTTICVGRWGNVAGSSGSVIPLFLDCLEKNIPFPITEPVMTRFWITLPRAVEFVIRCLLEGERGEILVPKLRSCTIEQIADAINSDHPATITGRRPGEKLHEVLIGYEEGFHTTDLGWAYDVYPQYHFWDRNYKPRGESVLPGFVFSSGTARQMSTEEIKAMIEEVKENVGRKA